MHVLDALIQGDTDGCLRLQVLDARAIGAHLGPCKGYGFVTMASVDAAAAAIRRVPLAQRQMLCTS